MRLAHTASRAQRTSERRSPGRAVDHDIRGAERVSNVEDRHAVCEKCCVVIRRAHRRRHDPKRYDRRRVTMRNTHDIGSRAINLTVEVAFDERDPATRITRLTVEGELHDVVGRHERGCKRP